MAERGGDRTLASRARRRAGESASRSPSWASAAGRGRQPFALGERLLERREPLACEPRAGREVVGETRRVVGRPAERGRARASGRLPACASRPRRRRQHRCAQPRRERLGRLAAKLEPLGARPQPVERGRRALARPGRVGQPLLGPDALGDERRELRLEPRPPLEPRRALARDDRPPPARGRRARASRSPPRCGASSCASFAARSAAVACSASGRSRLRTSASRSAARSTWLATRASFSSARWRRSLNRPEPGGLLDERAPLGRLRSRAPTRRSPARSPSAGRRRARRRRAARRGRSGAPASG